MDLGAVANTGDGSDGGWTPVGHQSKKKQIKHMSGKVAGKVQSGKPLHQFYPLAENEVKKMVLRNNRFYVPPKKQQKEAKEAGKSQGSGPVHKVDKNNIDFLALAAGDTKVGDSKGPSRSFKTNQRRARKRAEKRLGSVDDDDAKKSNSSIMVKADSTGLEAKCNPTIETPTKENGNFPVENGERAEAVNHTNGKKNLPSEGDCNILKLPNELSAAILAFLSPSDILNFGACNRHCSNLSSEGFLWRSCFQRDFPSSKLRPPSLEEWKLAYQMTSTKLADRLRCSYTKKTFFEDVLGSGVEFTVNPKTGCTDYISVSQDLIGDTAFTRYKVRSDVFGNKFRLFLPLYFSQEHFHRALPQIRRTVTKLCPERKTNEFEPSMILDVFPKIINTFIVLVADEGVSASRKSFYGLIRIHRLFLALAKEFGLQNEALRRLRLFTSKEEYRTKKACPSLGNILPLLMIVDEKSFSWLNLRSSYLSENLDRGVLWVCKKYPKLEHVRGPSGKPESAAESEERVELTRDAMLVSLRLSMFHVYFLRACCRGTNDKRAHAYDVFFGRADPEDILSVKGGSDEDSTTQSQAPLTCTHGHFSFLHFREQISRILGVNSWQQFFKFIYYPCPSSKAQMASLLRGAVKNSRRKRYHKPGMDFSRVQASGTSQILSKGMEYTASRELRRVIFRDEWGFKNGRKYLDATCLLYRGKTLAHTIDYRKRFMENDSAGEIVLHSGDMMRENGGTHTIHLNLFGLDAKITSCVFVISAWAAATLSDITSASISFTDADGGPDAEPLCTYDLDAHDKIAHLTSVIMCRLYRTTKGGWNVTAIGDSHGGAADNYEPIYKAVQKLL